MLMMLAPCLAGTRHYARSQLLLRARTCDRVETSATT